MSQEPIWRDYENKSDAEKALSRLKHIDENLDSIYGKLHDIDDKLLHSQSAILLRKINDTLVALGGYIIFFSVIIIILLYKMSGF